MKLSVRVITCYNCGHTNRLAASPEHPNDMPEDGDICICWNCGSLAFFDSTFAEGIRKPTPSERDEMMQDEEIIRMIIYWERNRKQMSAPDEIVRNRRVDESS